MIFNKNIVFLILCFVIFNVSVAGAVKSSKIVYQAQKSLTKKGYDCGDLDGLWGKRTEEAVRKFQRDNNLALTGVLDKETRLALGVNNAPVLNPHIGDEGEIGGESSRYASKSSYEYANNLYRITNTLVNMTSCTSDINYQAAGFHRMVQAYSSEPRSYNTKMDWLEIPAPKSDVTLVKSECGDDEFTAEVWAPGSRIKKIKRDLLNLLSFSLSSQIRGDPIEIDFESSVSKTSSKPEKFLYKYFVRNYSSQKVVIKLQSIKNRETNKPVIITAQPYKTATYNANGGVPFAIADIVLFGPHRDMPKLANLGTNNDFSQRIEELKERSIDKSFSYTILPMLSPLELIN